MQVHQGVYVLLLLLAHLMKMQRKLTPDEKFQIFQALGSLFSRVLAFESSRDNMYNCIANTNELYITE